MPTDDAGSYSAISDWPASAGARAASEISRSDRSSSRAGPEPARGVVPGPFRAAHRIAEDGWPPRGVYKCPENVIQCHLTEMRAIFATKAATPVIAMMFSTARADRAQSTRDSHDTRIIVRRHERPSALVHANAFHGLAPRVFKRPRGRLGLSAGRPGCSRALGVPSRIGCHGDAGRLVAAGRCRPHARLVLRPVPGRQLRALRHAHALLRRELCPLGICLRATRQYFRLRRLRRNALVPPRPDLLGWSLPLTVRTELPDLPSDRLAGAGRG